MILLIIILKLLYIFLEIYNIRENISLNLLEYLKKEIIIKLNNIQIILNSLKIIKKYLIYMKNFMKITEIKI